MRSVRSLGVLAVFAAVTTVPVAVGEPVHPSPVPDTELSATFDSKGTMHAAWVETVSGVQVIFYSELIGGQWAEPEVAVDGPGPVFDLTVLVLPDDSVCLYWSILSFYRSCLVEATWEEPSEIAFFSATASFVPAVAPEGEVVSATYQPPNLVLFGEQVLNEDDGAADVHFLVDSSGGYQVFWRNFMEGQGLVWRRSTDGGATWSDHEFLSGDNPLGDQSVGIDDQGVVHLIWGYSNHVFHRQWSEGSGWEPIEEVEVPTSIMTAAVASDGRVVVVGRNAGENFSLTRSSGGKWGQPEPLDGTDGRNLDRVTVVPTSTGEVEVMWHELGVEFYNQTTVSGEESFAGSVPTPGEVNLDPVVVAASAAITAGTLLLVPIPAELLNGTLAEHHDEIAGWFRRRRQARDAGFWQKPIGLVVFVVASALLFGFLDPTFGFNADSVPTFLGLLLGVVATTIGFAVPTLVMRRSATKEWGRLRALPVAMVVGIACVVLSRGIGFQPGYLYGIVLGTVFIATVGPEQEGREAAVTASLVLALTIGAWLLLAPVRSGGPGFGLSLLETALVTVMVAGIEALAIGLLPLRGLPGRALAARSRWLWLGSGECLCSCSFMSWSIPRVAIWLTPRSCPFPPPSCSWSCSALLRWVSGASSLSRTGEGALRPLNRRGDNHP